jgi:hypothetical protein
MRDVSTTRRLILALGGILLCGGMAVTGWILRRNRPVARTSGHFGEGFWWSEGRHTVLVGWPATPPDDAGPAFLVLLRWPEATMSHEFSFDNQSSDGDWHVLMNGSVIFADGRRFAAKYSVSANDPVARFVADGKEFSSAGGRLFLVDLAGSEPSIVQVPSDLVGVLQNPANASGPLPTDPTLSLRKAVNRLREQHDEVRRFLKDSALK